MSRPVLEVADIFRAWVGSYIDRNGPRISWPQLKDPRRRALPHGGARPPPRPLHRVWKRLRLLLQLVPQLSLSQVPDREAQPLGRGAHPRTGAAELLPRRLHRAAPTLGVDAAEQAIALRSAVSLRVRHPVGGGGEPEAVGSRDRLSVCAAYLGADSSLLRSFLAIYYTPVY